MNMKKKGTYFWKLPPIWLRFFIIIILVLGIFFRFTNLDRKIYWIDETHTSIRLSGYTWQERNEQLVKGDILSIQDLQKYQYPNSEKSLFDTVKSLAVEDVHPPFYFILGRFWLQLFGHSVAVIRSLSAFIGLLVIFTFYWLCRELFNFSLTAWIGSTLVAISPFHVLYAQEARPYTLLTLTILLSSVSLLRAIRLKTKQSWWLYAVTLALGFYSHLYFVFVAFGYGIYVVVNEGFRWSKTLKAYLLASCVGVLAIAPWIAIFIINSTRLDQSSWQEKSIPLSSLIAAWFHNISRVFADFWYLSSYLPDLNIPNLRLARYFIPLIAILVGYSIYFLCRYTSKQIWLFPLTLIGVTGGILIVQDLISGGQRSSLTRYLIPCYLGIELAVTYLLATKINPISLQTWQKKLWQVITITLISAGVLSCAISSQAEGWWNSYQDYNNPEVAKIINQAPYPLVISNHTPATTSLSYKLKTKVKLMLVKETIPKIHNNFSDLFLYKPSKTLRSQLEGEQNYQLELMYQKGRNELWQIKPILLNG